MEQSELQELLVKYNNSTCSAEEATIVENWYLQWSVQPEELNESDLVEVKAEVWQEVSREFQIVRTIRLWQRAGIAAAIALITLSFGIWLFQSDITDKTKTISYANDVAPGHRGATLTLANGKKIRLDSMRVGVVDNQSGLRISKTADGKLVYEYKGSSNSAEEIHTLSTEKGETYQVILPDSSVVWLNAATSLSFSTKLHTNSKRRVTLTGEGYFEVAKDKTHPFIVSSVGQEVEVLGTHFNVSAYSGEQIVKTTLLEGSVRVNANGIQKILTPGTEAVNTGQDINVNEVDATLSVAWKDDKFVFANENIENIMKKVERWYDVEVHYRGAIPLDKFEGTVSRFDKVSKVLSILESTGQVHFEVEGRKIYVFK
ncbi:FecR family protein [Pedobacter frigoris]|uniref:FecR family protein n=1 Tax=Pedobacter frigoris TaxID=2571272 RepID=UPI00292FF1D3|nr:FecR domain-containing protein [Pedobacter frigoris]